MPGLSTSQSSINMPALRLALILTLSCLVVANPVFDKYIELKRSLKTASLPAQEVVPPPPLPQGLNHDTGKTESDMRAAMLAKSSKNSGKKKNNKYASGHTFIPTVHTLNEWSTESNHSSKPPSKQPQPVKKAVERPPPQRIEEVQRQDHPQEVVEALVGQGGRTGAIPHVEETVTKSVWSGSKAIPATILGFLIWVCVLAFRKTGTKRKARSLKKRLTTPRLVA